MTIICHPLRIVELLVSCGAAHAGALDAPPVVASQHLGQVTGLTPERSQSEDKYISSQAEADQYEDHLLRGEHLAVPDAVELPGVVAHLLPAWGVTLQQSGN